MATYRMVVAYDGGPFHGFARQPDVNTVQGTIETAMHKILGTPVVTSAAGRTDAGVHALGQVMSFNTDLAVEPENLMSRLNSMCGPAIAILALEQAADGFDARFSAVARTYEYGIFTRSTPDPFARHTTWHYPHPLDADLMGKAAGALLGEHAFDSFGRVEEGRNPVRRVESIEIEQADYLTSIRITANSFIQQMVRSIVGTLVQVGTGKLSPDEMDRILHARNRAEAGPVAPPQGLFLVAVDYPEELA